MDGDWMEHCTALVEHIDGRMEPVGHTWLAAEPEITDRDADGAELPVEPVVAAVLAAGSVFPSPSRAVKAG